jgi:hypothetical protein
MGQCHVAVPGLVFGLMYPALLLYLYHVNDLVHVRQDPFLSERFWYSTMFKS